MQDAITNILSGITSVVTQLFTVSQSGDNTLVYVSLLPILSGVIGRTVAVTRKGRG